MGNHSYDVVPGILSIDKDRGKTLSVVFDVKIIDKKQKKKVTLNFSSAQDDVQFKAFVKEGQSGKMHWIKAAAGGDARRTSFTTTASLSDFKGSHNARFLVGEVKDDGIVPLALLVDPGHIRVPFNMYTMDKSLWSFGNNLQGTAFGEVSAG